MKKTARLFNCAHCQNQVVICSYCDRGNIYCGQRCSKYTRVLNHRIANKKYQKTLRGKQKHAERQRRYRQRQMQKMTDQGSPYLPPNDLLSVEPNEGKLRQPEPIFCHFCGEVVSSFLRNGYLRHHVQDESHDSSSWPLAP